MRLTLPWRRDVEIGNITKPTEYSQNRTASSCQVIFVSSWGTDAPHYCAQSQDFASFTLISISGEVCGVWGTGHPSTVHLGDDLMTSWEYRTTTPTSIWHLSYPVVAKSPCDYCYTIGRTMTSRGYPVRVNCHNVDWNIMHNGEICLHSPYIREWLGFIIILARSVP